MKDIFAGPVLAEDIHERFRELALKGGMSEEEKGEFTRLLRKIDRSWKEHIDERVENPEKTVIVMGAGHGLAERLERDYGVDRFNEPVYWNPITYGSLEDLDEI